MIYFFTTPDTADRVARLLTKHAGISRSRLRRRNTHLPPVLQAGTIPHGKRHRRTDLLGNVCSRAATNTCRTSVWRCTPPHTGPRPICCRAAGRSGHNGFDAHRSGAGLPPFATATIEQFWGTKLPLPSLRGIWLHHRRCSFTGLPASDIHTAARRLPAQRLRAARRQAAGRFGIKPGVAALLPGLKAAFLGFYTATVSEHAGRDSCWNCDSAAPTRVRQVPSFVSGELRRAADSSFCLPSPSLRQALQSLPVHDWTCGASGRARPGPVELRTSLKLSKCRACRAQRGDTVLQQLRSRASGTPEG